MWDEAKKVSRPAILALLKDKCKASVNWKLEELPTGGRRLVALSKDNLLSRFKTPRGRKVWETKTRTRKKATQEPEDSGVEGDASEDMPTRDEPTADVDCVGAELLQQIEEAEDRDLLQALQGAMADLETRLRRDDSGRPEQQDTFEGLADTILTENDETPFDEQAGSNTGLQPMSHSSDYRNQEPDTIINAEEDDLPDILDVGTDEEDLQMADTRPIHTQEQTVIDKAKTGVLEALTADQKTGKKWAGKQLTDLVALFQTEQKMSILTLKELDIIEGTIKSTLTQPVEAVVSYRKRKKHQKIQCLLCIFTQTSLPDTFRRPRRLKQVSSLSSLAFRVLRSKKIPKSVLNVVYADYIYPARLKMWQEEGPVKGLIKLQDVESEVPEYWYSQPELSSRTGGLLAKTCSHKHTWIPWSGQ